MRRVSQLGTCGIVAGGFLLVLAMWVVLAVAGLVTAGMTLSTSALLTSHRFATNEQAFQLAEAGLDDALAVLNAGSVEWDDELRGLDDLPGTSDDGILPFGLYVDMKDIVHNDPAGYSVLVTDNDDEVIPEDATDEERAAARTTDQDGVIRVTASGMIGGHERTIIAYLWAMFNHAIAANEDVVLKESSALGDIHANRDIVVEEDSALEGDAQATAHGTFIFNGELTYNNGDLIGGDPRVIFPRPNVAVLASSVNEWDPDPDPTINIIEQQVVGYHDDATTERILIIDIEEDLEDVGTLVMFDGSSLTIDEKLCGEDQDYPGKFNQMVDLNIILVGRDPDTNDPGTLTFMESACIRGLIWAEGSITLNEHSITSGAVVSATGSVTVDEKSSVGFNRDAIQESVLPGFSGSTILSWQED